MSYTKFDKLKNHFKSFNTIPFVSIGVPLNNAHIVSINNEYGMCELMKHLIEYHGYKNIAFICEQKNNLDAVTRLNIYKKMLTKYNIPIREELITNGLFHKSQIYGKNAVKTLIEKRNLTFDALIGSNDFLASGAVKELKRRGIKVPEDVAVVGFDNITECQYTIPALTTVNQPLFELGYNAAKLLFSELSNEEIPYKKSIKSSLIIRNSCGCSSSLKKNNFDHIKILSKYHESKSSEQYFLFRLTDIMKKEFKGFIDSTVIYKWAKQIFKSFFNEINNDPTGNLILDLEKIIKEGILYQVDTFSWNFIIIHLFFEIIPMLQLNDKTVLINNIFIDISKLIQEIILKKYQYSKIISNKRDLTLFLFKRNLKVSLV